MYWVVGQTFDADGGVEGGAVGTDGDDDVLDSLPESTALALSSSFSKISTIVHVTVLL